MSATQPGRWLVPSMRATRKHYFPHGERLALCQNATRDQARRACCGDRCAACKRKLKPAPSVTMSEN